MLRATIVDKQNQKPTSLGHRIVFGTLFPCQHLSNLCVSLNESTPDVTSDPLVDCSRRQSRGVILVIILAIRPEFPELSAITHERTARNSWSQRRIQSIETDCH